jgi:hypothetical protein
MSGLMFHKEDIVVAAAEGVLRGEVREYGRNRQHAGGIGAAGAQARS